jgi:hypothetical protein
LGHALDEKLRALLGRGERGARTSQLMEVALDLTNLLESNFTLLVDVDFLREPADLGEPFHSPKLTQVQDLSSDLVVLQQENLVIGDQNTQLLVLTNEGVPDVDLVAKLSLLESLQNELTSSWLLVIDLFFDDYIKNNVRTKKKRGGTSVWMSTATHGEKLVRSKGAR